MFCMSQPSTSRLFPQTDTSIFESPVPQRTVSQLLTSTTNALLNSPPSPIRRQPSPDKSLFSPEELALAGIKVRDFAYESKLPPIPPYRPQTQPLPQSPRRLARHRPANEDDGYRTPWMLERLVTEPAIEPSSQVRRQIGQTTDSLMHAAEIVSDHDWYYPQSQPPLADSQESDPHVETPIVTPNGSLQWIRDTSSLPASQLDSESQNTAPEMFSYAELGFSQPEDDAMDVDVVPRIESRFGSPLSPMSTPPLSSPSPPPPSSPRYNFRKRPSPTPTLPDEPPTSRPRRPANSRTSHQKAGSSKPRPVRAAQAARSRSKPNSKRP